MVKFTFMNSFINKIKYVNDFFRELQASIEMFKQKNLPSTVNVLSKAVQDDFKTGVLKYQMTYHPDKAKAQDVARISHLEKRLGHIENLIGTSCDNTSKCSQV